MRFRYLGTVSEIDNLPGCDQVAVFHNVWMPEKERGKGYGNTAHRERMRVAHNLGYDAAVCTVRFDNYAEKTILKKNGWKNVFGFKSSKTGNYVELWVRDVEVIPGYNPKDSEYKTYDEWERSLQRPEIIACDCSQPE
jgi:hypothetical protein